MPEKRVSAAAITALREALVAIYWYKGDLKSFLAVAVSNHDLLTRLDWSSAKRNIVEELISYLTRFQDVHQADLLRPMHEVTRMEDFRHLQRLDDGAEKTRRARESIAALKALYQTYQDVVDEYARVEQNRKIEFERQLQNKGVREKLDELRAVFTSLLGTTNPQQRGYALEGLLKELFVLFDLDPKASFRVQGEQIDGAFSFDGTDYLLEAKWQKALVDISDLDAFSGKLSRKLDNTLGLFISVNGFSKDAVAAHSAGKRLMILMDGSDLMAVLDERIGLPSLLLRKRRFASETGDIYLPVSNFLYS